MILPEKTGKKIYGMVFFLSLVVQGFLLEFEFRVVQCCVSFFRLSGAVQIFLALKFAYFHRRYWKNFVFSFHSALVFPTGGV